ncbi:multicopper oxidase domain-containing protein [Streptomyces lomondensis]|nr:multicopper oxidase domain-containing protein [Streptomyces lomondensis]MCF0079589.1 multicopper oxidase domain-containing protein [Streptomyces lomondensis]
MRAAAVRRHSQLPPTPVWTYDGHLPGPTFEVRRGERLRVTWTNNLSGAFPLTAVEVPATEQTPAVWDQPGRGGYPARDRRRRPAAVDRRPPARRPPRQRQRRLAGERGAAGRVAAVGV